ncbi:hypothetical protein J6590_016932 [Homalodisca vitripennis]|nr:hypothetical protein J6590_016932 [Homalodisca vitripennis]
MGLPAVAKASLNKSKFSGRERAATTVCGVTTATPRRSLLHRRVPVQKTGTTLGPSSRITPPLITDINLLQETTGVAPTTGNN